MRAGGQARRHRRVARGDRGELRGGEDYANLLPGVFSARVYIKQANARMQTLLEKRAEPLADVRLDARRALPRRRARYAWKTLLQNHPHDSICGCSIDAVHEENMTRFAPRRAGRRARVVDRGARRDRHGGSRGAARSCLRRRRQHRRCRARAGGRSGRRRAVRERRAAAPRGRAGARSRRCRSGRERGSITAVDEPGGQRCEFQVLDEERVVSHVMSRFETPWALNVRRLHVLWWAEALPPCGFTAFDLRIAAPGVFGAAKAAPDAQERRPPIAQERRPIAARTGGASSQPGNARRRTSGCVLS